MKGVLLLSHGKLSEGVIDSLQILGMDMAKVEAIALDLDSELEEYTKAIGGKIDELDDGEGVLVITDILSGTPFNRVCLLYEEKNIEVISGLSLPMVISAINFRDSCSLEELSQKCIEEAMAHMLTLKSLLQ